MTTKRKQIMFFSRPLAPPWDEASKNLAFELAQNIQGNFEFHLLTTKRFAKKIKSPTIVPEPIFSSSSFHWLSKFRLLIRLYFGKLDFDIIHFPFTPRSLTSFFILLRLKFFKGKVVQTVAALPKEHLNKKKLKKIFFADRIITQSKFTQKALASTGTKNIEMIYPGINLETYSQEQKDLQFMSELGISPQDFVIVYAGEYTKIKGVDNVVESFFKLHDSAKNKDNLKLILSLRIKNKFDIIKRNQLFDMIKKAGYTEKVIFMSDHRERLSKKFGKFMSRVYNLSSVNVFPVAQMTGKFDIPYVIIEAMACGKPMIVSDLPILVEHISDGKNGLVVPKENPLALTRAIKKLKNDPDQASLLGSNARKYARQNFNIKDTAKNYASIYENL